MPHLLQIAPRCTWGEFEMRVCSHSYYICSAFATGDCKISSKVYLYTNVIGRVKCLYYMFPFHDGSLQLPNHCTPYYCTAHTPSVHQAGSRQTSGWSWAMVLCQYFKWSGINKILLWCCVCSLYDILYRLYQ